MKKLSNTLYHTDLSFLKELIIEGVLEHSPSTEERSQFDFKYDDLQINIEVIFKGKIVGSIVNVITKVGGVELKQFAFVPEYGYLSESAPISEEEFSKLKH